MRERVRNAAAIVIAALCLVVAVSGLILASELSFNGITLRQVGTYVVVATVNELSPAYGDVRPGMIVRELDSVAVGDISAADMEAYLRGEFHELGIVDRTTGMLQRTFTPDIVPPSTFVFLVGVALLAGIATWVGRGHAGETLRPLALPLAVASTFGLILLPAWSTGSLFAVLAMIALPIAALLVLADGFIDHIRQPARRRAATAIAGISAILWVLVDLRMIALNVSGEVALDEAFLPWIVDGLAAGMTVVPAAFLVTSIRGGRASPADPGRVDRLSVLLAALTPVVIIATSGFVWYGLGLTLPLVWLLVVMVVLQSHAQVLTLRTQRDAVVAATEVERARLAADLHDDALQEMTVLVRRLDDAGNADDADLARSIADRLREICGELRLPILDELGAGSALEWLVERVGETTGREVRLERDDSGRPPADVELAVFRIAQEALANAVTHGAPPITVRYASGPDRASLSVTDRGVGITSDAAAVASRTGHYGLLNIRQRAEQIGATLDVQRPPEGGTIIGLQWSSA